jgi:hypothetical protein
LGVMTERLGCAAVLVILVTLCKAAKVGLHEVMLLTFAAALFAAVRIAVVVLAHVFVCPSAAVAITPVDAVAVAVAVSVLAVLAPSDARPSCSLS